MRNPSVTRAQPVRNQCSIRVQPGHNQDAANTRHRSSLSTAGTEGEMVQCLLMATFMDIEMINVDIVCLFLTYNFDVEPFL